MRLQADARGTGFCLLGRRLIVAFLLLCNGAFAQQSGTGTLTGTIANQATGDYLAGAQVRIDGSNLSTASERGGTYRLTVPAGSHTLVVSFTGLDTARIPVTVVPGQNTVQDVGLTSQIYALEEYSVTGLREGSALAIQMQRQSTNVRNVAATDTFGNPAANPGELIQRLPGITTDIVGGEVRQIQIRGMDRTFNSVMVDGNKTANAGSASFIREVQIEQMGTHSIETVEVIKAPTPDMDADAIAGYVNLVSKRAFDRPPGRRITFNVGSVWKVREDDGSPEKDAPSLDLLALGYSEVFSVMGGENNLGVSLSALGRRGYTLQDEVTHNYRRTGAVDADDPILQQTFGTREFVNPDYTYNFGLSADYKLSDDAYLFARLTANQRYQYQRFRGTSTTAGAAVGNYEPGWTYEYTKAKPVAASRTDTFSGLFTKKTYNYTFNVGGEHKLAGWQLNYDGFVSYAKSWYPDRNEIRASVPGVGWEVDRRDTDPWYPKFNQYAGPDILDPDNYKLGNLTFFRTASNHTVRGMKLDLRRDFDTAVPTFMKTGLKWGEEQRVRDYNHSRFTYIGPQNGISEFLDPNYNYMQTGGRYGPFPFMQLPFNGQPGDIGELFRSNPEYWDNDLFYTTSQHRLNDDKIKETIKAGYVMGNIDFGRFRVLGGVRVEQTETRGQAYKHVITAEEQALRTAWGKRPLTDDEEIRRALAEYPELEYNQGEYRKVFPGVHLVYEPMDGAIFRASWNTSVTRPPVGQVLPGFDVNEETSRVTIGNPNLRPFFSDNFEFSFEKYFEPIGIVGVGLFLKEIEDYSQIISTTIGEGPDNGFQGEFVGYELRQRQNTGDARIRGIELNYDQQFSFLPGFWRGFGLFGNFTYLEATGDFGGTSVQRRLGGQTPRSGNGGISYVNYGWQIRLMANWRDEHYRSSSGINSLYREERLLMDLKVQYALNRKYDLFLDVANLGDVPTRADIREFNRKEFRTTQGTTFSAGVKGRF